MTSNKPDIVFVLVLVLVLVLVQMHFWMTRPTNTPVQMHFWMTRPTNTPVQMHFWMTRPTPPSKCIFGRLQHNTPRPNAFLDDFDTSNQHPRPNAFLDDFDTSVRADSNQHSPIE